MFRIWLRSEKTATLQKMIHSTGRQLDRERGGILLLVLPLLLAGLSSCGQSRNSEVSEALRLAGILQRFAPEAAQLLEREHATANDLKIILDESLAQCDPAAAEAIWEHAGLAIPLQINFALSGAARLIREIRAALHRREREQALAHKAAAVAIEAQVKTTVAGLLLHSQLALSAGEMSSGIADKLRLVADLANSLRQQLNAPARAARQTSAPTL